MKLKLLFICSGNTCRSPLAQGLASKVFADWDVEIQSAGLHAWEGERASPHVLQILREKGINLQEHQSRRLLQEWMEEVDWVIPMTKDQEKALWQSFPQYKDKIRRLGSWGGREEEVVDPFGGSLEVYRKSAELIETLLYEMKNELSTLTKGEG